MSNDSNSNGPDETGEGAPETGSGEKITVPPPADFDAGDAEEATLLAKIPEELIESIRSEESGARERPQPVGGLRQMFSRDPAPIRHALPSEEEGDALLDMLFEDQQPEAEAEADDVVTSAPKFPPPSGPGRGAARPPPLPPRAAAGPPPRPPGPPPRPPVPPPRAATPPPRPAGPPPRPPGPPPRPPKPREHVEAFAVEPPPISAGPASAQPLSSDVTRPAPQEVAGEGGDRTTPVPDGDVESPFEFAPPSVEPSSIADEATQIDGGIARSMAAAAEGPMSDPTETVGDDELFEEPEAAAEEPAPFEEAPERAPSDAGAEAFDPGDAALLEPEPELDAAAAPEETGEPLPSLPPPAVVFDNEQDASATLVQRQQLDAWAARAAWLRAEAEALEDKTARARALLPVAELYVMAGEDATARAVASEARELAPSLVFAHRMVRGLLMRDGEHVAALDALDAETRILATAAARCHNAMLAAEISRIPLADPEGAHKRLEQAIRVQPSDPRPHVQRLCEALAGDGDGAPASIAKFRLPDAADLAPLAAAAAQIAAHRGAPSRGRGAAATPYEGLLRARAHLAGGDVAGTLAALEPLRRTALGGGAAWLGAALSAARAETRPAAVEALRSVASGTHGAAARRALAARAIELGDAAAAQAATDDAGDAFSAADRVALAALVGGTRDDVEPWLDALLGDIDLVPISAAASAALSEPATTADEAQRAGRHVHAVGGIRARVAASLGRALSRDAIPTTSHDGHDAFSRAVVAHADIAPDSPVSQALLLELDLESHHGGHVAKAIAAMRQGEGERDGALAGALLEEIAGEVDRALAGYDRARLADPQHEGAARARAARETGVESAQILAEHAVALEEGTRAAVLLTEAAIRLLDADQTESGERLLSRAAQMDPKLPIAPWLGERGARARVDRDGVIEWLRARREAATDPLEQAHDLVREGLLVADADPGAAASLLEQALQARPQDSGLRELFERLTPEPPTDRAAWRADRAAESTGVEAARLALEAALEYERAGDWERAAASAQRAIAAGDTTLAPIAQYRAARAGHGAGELIDTLMPKARETEDVTERREIYERLAELDELGRKDVGSALLWRRSILEDSPSHLPTLRQVASALIAEGRDEELEPVALEIARNLEGPEAIAHAQLAARLRLRTLPWEETREPVEIAYRNDPRGVWALRQMAAHARVRGEHALAIEADRQLIERTDRPSEAAALSVRAAKDAALAGSIEDAVAFFKHAITVVPHYLVAHLELADVLEGAGEAALAAEALDAAAAASATPEVRAYALYRAAVLWQDKASDASRARAGFEAVASIDPSYADVFPRLQTIYIAEGARAELAALLERRLDAVTDPTERVEMEVLRGRALADVGDAAAAKNALAAALDANPDHVEALSAFADVCAREEDWTGAEQAWIRLARLAPEPEKQIAIYLRLGELYDEHLPNPERAELAYQEILKRAPSDASARERLVGLYKRTGDTARAMEQQNILINAAETPEDKCRRTAELAEIFEAMGDAKKAEATLLQARKTWPKDDFALGALARFYMRTEQAPAANVLLDRAIADARRALNTGRFEPYLFSTVATVAELRGRSGAARIAQATVAALDGRDAAMGGAGTAAGDTQLDELLAPEVMTAAFRELLQRTGATLDRAFPFDLDSIRATPLPDDLGELADLARSLGSAYGLPGVEVYVTAALGAVCVPAAPSPPTIVLGQSLVASPREDVRTFLIHRALKILQSNGAAFSRTAPIDLWPVLAAFLKAQNPSWTPQGVDPARLNESYGRITKAMTGSPDPQLGVLAADVIGTIGNRASTLNTVINGWGNRAALLALGDLNVALTGIAWSGGHTNAPPAEGKDRLTWIGRNAEARDLIVFAVSDGFAEARERLGLDG